MPGHSAYAREIFRELRICRHFKSHGITVTTSLGISSLTCCIHSLLTLWPSISTGNPFTQCISPGLPFMPRLGMFFQHRLSETARFSILDLSRCRQVTSDYLFQSWGNWMPSTSNDAQIRGFKVYSVGFLKHLQAPVALQSVSSNLPALCTAEMGCARTSHGCRDVKACPRHTTSSSGFPREPTCLFSRRCLVSEEESRGAPGVRCPSCGTVGRASDAGRGAWSCTGKQPGHVASKCSKCTG